ncbi:NAD(P)/FAD-dependent oxidoreductase [Mediterraneibacter sp. NSJ-55]|uniref:NAD(P)/FAD-dependent oxidoreductase n=1 Tax=Mediterraneibacter hominis TaxID=2763054 RepID=A0A923LGI9_9FIRM|nr:NAD(P)/FAD-dependent oxidoreductase [Mediterraneibacter hominis]MBC5687890.1 NAD(P)/FAD-dependent oxidoreductase [Mediterraneibacter hominis]
MSRVLIIGGGAAGMAGAVFAAEKGSEVHVFEKNEKLGKKLFITGKGRCNFTNAADAEVFFSSVVRNPKFLYSGFYSFTNEQAIDFFEGLGVKTKIERGGRVFPASDHSSDIIQALKRKMEKLGVQIHLHTEVADILVKDQRFYAVRLKDGKTIEGDACIVASGGLSYPSTGSTGDGYRFARKCGHTVTELLPALVPIEVKEWYVKELQGLSLRNIRVQITDGKRKVYEEFGEMLFTHYGVTGPVILSASSIVGNILKKKELMLHIDLKPALSVEKLEQRVLREFESNHNRQFKNVAASLFPSKLRPVMVELSGITSEKKINEITREERKRFISLIKDFQMTLTRTREYKEAIITQGGVNVKEIDPGTMESKLVKHLYFAGEVIDVDALTGGFNLQVCWSTAYLAAAAASDTI